MLCIIQEATKAGRSAAILEGLPARPKSTSVGATVEYVTNLPPASTSNTRMLGSSDSRAAKAHPEVPAAKRKQQLDPFSTEEH